MTSAQASTFREPDRAPDDVATDFGETSARPRLPRDDVFYQPPAEYLRAAPGSILRSRKVTLAFLGRIRQRVSATQLLYRTTDLLGNPSVAVTTVLAPDGAPGGLLSYQCAIDAVSDRCFPSYALRHGARAAGALAQFEYLLIVAALAEGWTVSIPDHESRDGRWGVPREPGYIALDGLRAVLSDNNFGLSADAPVGIWGYSGGGLASAWASEMHQSYAPELNVVGAALGSPVGDPGHTFRRLNGTLYAALPGLVVAALSRVYPELRAVIDDHVTERGKRLLDAISSMTTVPALVRMAGRDMGRLVDQPLDDILGKPEIETIFEEIKLGKQAPTHPVLMVQAVHDRIIAAEDIDALAATYVAGGTAVTYHRDRCSEHLLLHALSAPMSLRWLADRAAGQRVEPERQGRPLLARRATYRGLWQIALVCLRVLVGRGPGRRA